MLPDVIREISDDPFITAPSGLEPPQPVILRFGPAEAEASVSIPAVPLDRLPDEEIVGPQVEKLFVRCAVFVHRPAPEVEEDRAGNCLSLVERKHYDALIF